MRVDESKHRISHEIPVWQYLGMLKSDLIGRSDKDVLIRFKNFYDWHAQNFRKKNTEILLSFFQYYSY